jgi:mannosyltransferase
MRTAPMHRLLLPALLLLALAVRMVGLGRNELAHDEPFTVYWAHQGLGNLFAMLRTENNPPLFFLLIKAWLPVAGHAEGLLRLPSALFSALTVWPLFLLARRHAGPMAAWVAVLLFILNQHLHGYAHEVRAYSLFVLLTTTAMWHTSRLADGRPGARWWLLLVNVALVYTHFFGWLAVGLQGLCVLLVPAWRKAWRPWLVALGLLVVSYLPYAGLLVLRASESISEGTWLQAPAPDEIYNMVWRWSNAPVIAVLLLLLTAVTLARKAARGTALLLGAIWCFVPLIGMYLVSFQVPIYLDRYLTYAAPGFYLLVGHGIASLPAGIGRPAAAALVLGLLFSFDPLQGNGLHPSRAVAQVEAWRSEHPQAQVLVLPPWYRQAYLWAAARERFGQEPPAAIHDPVLHPSPVEDPPVTIVVDAVVQHEDHRAMLRDLRNSHGRHDSVEVYRKLWVHRFHR